MSVQTTAGPIVMDGTNFIRTDRGVTWGIAFKDVGIGLSVFVATLGPDGVWRPDQLMQSAIDDGFDIKMAEEGFTVIKWFREVFLPKLNLWLAARFPATGVSPPPVSTDPFQQAHDLVFAALVITVNPDGTLTASAR